MRLPKLNQLVFKMIERGDFTLPQLAARLEMSEKKFKFKLENGLLDFEQIKQLRLGHALDPQEFARAMDHDLGVLGDAVS